VSAGNKSDTFVRWVFALVRPLKDRNPHDMDTSALDFQPQRDSNPCLYLERAARAISGVDSRHKTAGREVAAVPSGGRRLEATARWTRDGRPELELARARSWLDHQVDTGWSAAGSALRSTAMYRAI
jgi:hypothetical protein